MLLNIVNLEIANPFKIPHVKEIGSVQDMEKGLYVKFTTPQVCEETINRIQSSSFTINVHRVISSDTIYLDNVDRFFVKNK